MQAEVVKLYAEAGAIDTKMVVEKAKVANDRIDIERQSMKDLGELLNKQEDRKVANRNNGGEMATQSNNAGSSQTA